MSVTCHSLRLGGQSHTRRCSFTYAATSSSAQRRASFCFVSLTPSSLAPHVTGVSWCRESAGGAAGAAPASRLPPLKCFAATSSRPPRPLRSHFNTCDQQFIINRQCAAAALHAGSDAPAGITYAANEGHALMYMYVRWLRTRTNGFKKPLIQQVWVVTETTHYL